MNFPQDVIAAEKRIRPYILQTPIEYSPILSQLCEANVWLKMEHLQITGSFKLRGATNKLMSLNPSEREQGVVTASTGNHGSAFAYIADKLNCKGTIYLPADAAQAKVDMMRMYQVDLEMVEGDPLESEKKARKVAEEQGLTFISPYNDPAIVAGQGTVGLELQQQLPNLESVWVPVGGGGLISGIAGYLKTVNSRVEIIGCLPENSPVMYESIKAGHVVDMETYPTLSDGTAGGMEGDSITFGLCQKYVNDYCLLSEKEIKAGLLFLLEKHYMLVEGSAALSVAALMKNKERVKGKTVVLILCGRKMGLETLRKIICE